MALYLPDPLGAMLLAPWCLALSMRGPLFRLFQDTTVFITVLLVIVLLVVDPVGAATQTQAFRLQLTCP